MTWAHRIGPARAKDMLFTGDLIDGTKAHEWGLALCAPPTAEAGRAEAVRERDEPYGDAKS